MTLKMGPFETESSKWEIVARKNCHRFHIQTVLRYYEHNIAIYGSICLLVLKMFVTRDMLIAIISVVLLAYNTGIYLGIGYTCCLFGFAYSTFTQLEVLLADPFPLASCRCVELYWLLDTYFGALM